LNQIIALTKSINELLDKNFENRLENWIEQILDADFNLNIELKDYLILSDFFCLNLCLKVPSQKFVKLMRDLFVSLLSKLKQCEDSDQEIISVLVFFVKVTKIWMKIESIRSLKSYEEFPDPRAKPKGNSSTSKIGTPSPLNFSSSSKENLFIKMPAKYGFHKKFFLLENQLFIGFIGQIWWFYKQIKDSETKFYDNLQQRVYLEVLNCMFTILSELFKYTKYTSLDIEPYNFQGGFNLFTQIFSSINDKIKNLEFRTIMLKFAFLIFKNRYSLFSFKFVF
jgi:hypothetical protein